MRPFFRYSHEEMVPQGTTSSLDISVPENELRSKEAGVNHRFTLRICPVGPRTVSHRSTWRPATRGCGVTRGSKSVGSIRCVGWTVIQGPAWAFVVLTISGLI